jgi:hypothetical protein
MNIQLKVGGYFAKPDAVSALPISAIDYRAHET